MYGTRRTRPRITTAGTAVTAVLGVLLGLLVAVGGPLALPGRAIPQAQATPTTYGAPSWWKGDCDTDNWTAKARAAGWTGAAASRLGGEVLGIPVCGPRNLAGAPNIWWSRSGWGELEWQCVEFAQRFMIQVYGVSPYQANGVDVVNHYTTAQGGGLVKITNGTVGTAPQPGDVVSFSSPSNSAGHVAVVASTSVDGNGNGSVRLATQNDTVDGWRTLTVSNWKVAAFGSLYPYAWLHDPLGRGTGGVGGDSSIQDGTFVAYAGSTFVVAGGAPLVVTDPSTVGGATPVVAVDAARFATLRAVPRDATFLHDAGTGRYWRVAGGDALPVDDCHATGMLACAGAVDVDPAAVARAGSGGTFDHLRTSVADGTFLRVGDDGAPDIGTIGRAAGGAVIPVAACDDLGGCGSWVTVQLATWNAYRQAHPVPVDGTVVRLDPSDRFASFSGGQCATIGGEPTGWTAVPERALTCASPLRLDPAPTAPVVQHRPVHLSLGASGGTAPYTFRVAAGRLPTGLTLSSDGVLDGTPSSVGTRTVTVQVTDSARPRGTASSRMTFTVAPPIAVTSAAPATLVVGTRVDLGLDAAGGTGAYSWDAMDPLPAGLTLDPGGVLSGTPTARSTSTVRMRVTDTAAPTYSDTVTWKLVVRAAG